MLSRLSLLVLVSAPLASASFLSAVVGDHTCPGGQQTCTDSEPCCAFDPNSYGCCGGGGTESCCSDDTGGVCCVLEPTSCVSKNAQYPYPARCCPRETIGCGAGTVGCCNPARAWQRGPPLNPPSPAPEESDATLSKTCFARLRRLPELQLRPRPRL